MKLTRAQYLSFPFTIDANGGRMSSRLDHIREQVEQVIFTSPGERVFRPEFGFGARQHVFEGNSEALWETVRNRLYGSLVDTLEGEIDPKTLRVDVGAEGANGEQLRVRIEYEVAALRKRERHEFRLNHG